MKKVFAAVLAATLTACGPEEVRATDTALTDAPSSLDTAQNQAAKDAPSKDDLPDANGPCPEFDSGDAVFHPAGMPERRVRLYMSSAAKKKNGPLIFFWYGTGGSPADAVTNPWTPGGFSPEQLEDIKDQGGIVAAPYNDPTSPTWPWFYVSYDRNDDLRVADEVVACAIKKVGINVRRIHSIGFSAGALNTTQMSYRRSNYIASVVTYSGGFQRDMPNQDPSNKFSALIFHGGPSDFAGMSFQDASQKYFQDLKNTGHFAVICDHGLGHNIPPGHPGVWKFLQDHPYGVKDSYPGGLPDSFLNNCHK